MAPATEGARVGLVAEAICGERIAVEDESCDWRLGCGLDVVG